MAVNENNVTNSIGDFEFVSLKGIPMPAKQECVVLSRPGVEGVAVWLTSARGQKFTLRSSVDTASQSDADAKFKEYIATIGGSPVQINWNGIALSCYVVVLDVRPVQCSGLLIGVGGLASSSGGFLECDWDLIVVNVDTADA